MDDARLPLLGLELPELKALAARAGQPAFRAGQLHSWLYRKAVADLDGMSDLPAAFRDWLDGECRLGRVAPVKCAVSSDGTKKYLYPAGNGRFVEAAWIPEPDRSTLCLSTQVGCKMGCSFCATARQGFQGQLGAGGIVNQYLSLPERGQVTNIVYMGMGEPFDNEEAVMASLRLFTDPAGIAFSPRRITVSTVGVTPVLERFLAASECHLAISLHSPFDEERRRLMPVQQAWPISGVIALLAMADFSGQRRLSFEYILFDGVNDSPAHARELVRLLNGLRCRVNLINYHSVPGAPLQGSPPSRVEEFQNLLKAKGLMTTVRRSRGLDIQAACGLLSTREMPGTQDADI